MLLRVGIDKGCGGALGPIFEDGSFEYIPIPEDDPDSIETRTYSNTKGWSGKPFAYYLHPRIKDSYLHFDPEFESFTYGDSTAKRNYLLKLDEDDLLIFYAGLAPYRNDKYVEALYLIGYFTIERIIDFNQLSGKEVEKVAEKYSNNAHLKRAMDYQNLVIVVGKPEKSRLLDKSILISYRKYDKLGRPYHAVSPQMEKLLNIHGSIQRSIPPRIIEGNLNLENIKKLLKNKKNLK